MHYWATKVQITLQHGENMQKGAPFFKCRRVNYTLVAQHLHLYSSLCENTMSVTAQMSNMI